MRLAYRTQVMTIAFGAAHNTGNRLIIHSVQASPTVVVSSNLFKAWDEKTFGWRALTREFNHDASWHSDFLPRASDRSAKISNTERRRYEAPCTRDQDFGFRPALIGSGVPADGDGSEKKVEMSTDSATARRSIRSMEALCLPLSKSLMTVRSTCASTARFSCVTFWETLRFRRFQAMRARVSICYGHHLALH
ncbi:hypothetical protein M2310_003190 [Rhizobium leguminosarum]|uniref:Uncharacterized protein n=1 Tax=Rhizobium esperanzae TaxID=1967781 RepID=A0A7W6UNJ1_9HYPH|nr:hypothetical protein [Rhizobium esperanzae]MDH6202509.1 hypothetical protein [Rhizobium leguminosarum]